MPLEPRYDAGEPRGQYTNLPFSPEQVPQEKPKQDIQSKYQASLEEISEKGESIAAVITIAKDSMTKDANIPSIRIFLDKGIKAKEESYGNYSIGRLFSNLFGNLKKAKKLRNDLDVLFHAEYEEAVADFKKSITIVVQDEIKSNRQIKMLNINYGEDTTNGKHFTLEFFDEDSCTKATEILVKKYGEDRIRLNKNDKKRVIVGFNRLYF